MYQIITTLTLFLNIVAVILFIKRFYFRKNRPGLWKKILITFCLIAFWLSWSDLFLQLALACPKESIAWICPLIEALGQWGLLGAILLLDEKYGQNKAIHTPIILLLMVFPLLSFFWFYGYHLYMDPFWTDSQHDQLANHIGIFSWITMILLNALICFLYYAILEVQSERIASALLSQQFEAERRHYEDVEEMQRLVRGLSHDLNNMLSTADVMLQKEQYSELHQLIHGMGGRIATPQQFLNTGNPALDNIISLKLSKAKTLQIPFQTDIDIPGDLQLNFEAMATIFGNLLDNAIEAQEPLPPEQREIRLKLKYMDQMLVAAVSNRCEAKDSAEDLLQTTKDNPEFHGFGTTNIRQSIARLGGTIRFHAENDWFHADFLLYEVLPDQKGTSSKNDN